MKRTAQSTSPNISAGRPYPGAEPGAQWYIMGACRIIVGLAPDGWHLSISCVSRYPTWDEVAKARYELIPDGVTMAMLLPPRDQYVNLMNFCLHLWQLPTETEKV
jgi:hypothetical protein